MRNALVAVAALAALAVPTASRAQEEAAAPAAESAAPAQQEAASPAAENAAAPAEAASHEEKGEGKHGLQIKLGLGAGYGLPMGDVKGDEKLSNLYSGEIPIELEVSYKFTHAISAGVYAGYGLGLVSSKEVDVGGMLMKASDHIDSIASVRLGVQGEYEFGKLGPALPFAALRVGYVTESIAHKGGETEKASGWEYATAIVGADFEITESFGVGPFVSYSLGQYTAETPAGGSSESIPSADRALHEWLTIGLRGAFTL